MNTISARRGGAIALLGVVCAAGPVAATIQVLPGGASALQEAHGDWRVACELQNGQKACALSQQIMDKDSRQRILAIELSGGTPNAADGTLALPFGLALDKGITLQIDESAAGPALSFRTCLPAGCIVAVAFDAKMIAALKAGTTLRVKATGDNAQEVSFGISLNGFASALDRTAALTK